MVPSGLMQLVGLVDDAEILGVGLIMTLISALLLSQAMGLLSVVWLTK